MNQQLFGAILNGLGATAGWVGSVFSSFPIPSAGAVLVGLMALFGALSAWGSYLRIVLGNVKFRSDLRKNSDALDKRGRQTAERQREIENIDLEIAKLATQLTNLSSGITSSEQQISTARETLTENAEGWDRRINILEEDGVLRGDLIVKPTSLQLTHLEFLAKHGYAIWVGKGEPTAQDVGSRPPNPYTQEIKRVEERIQKERSQELADVDRMTTAVNNVKVPESARAQVPELARGARLRRRLRKLNPRRRKPASPSSPPTSQNPTSRKATK